MIMGCEPNPLIVAHSWMPFIACYKCGVQGALTKTDRHVIKKSAVEMTLEQLVNLYSKMCNSQDTTSWGTFLWVESIRESGPNIDSNSAVLEIFRHENRKSASKANRMLVTDDVILPSCSKSKGRSTACCFCAKGSVAYLSRLNRWSIVQRCFL